MGVSLEFYQDIPTKNWSINRIKEGLQISDKFYSQLCSDLEAEMRSHRLLGKRMNTSTSKHQLSPVFQTLYTRYQSVFDAIPSSANTWKDKCMTALAQRCNYNKKRRDLTITSQTLSEVSLQQRISCKRESPANLNESQQPKEIGTQVARLPALALYVYRAQSKDTMVCLARDLVYKEMEHTMTVKDMQWELFLKVLSEDIGYSMATDIILYNYDTDRKLEISNERRWKTTIEEMLQQNMKRFEFTVEHRDSGESSLFKSAYSNIIQEIHMQRTNHQC